MSPNRAHRFRFRPRFRALAIGAIALGAVFAGLSAVVAGELHLAPLAAGGAGVLLGSLYLASPTWRLAVEIDDQALAVASPRRQRFRLLWTDVVEVVASPRTETCFVDGGAPAHSLLVPGPGAPASYDIENKQALYHAICARVPRDRIREVELLETASSRPPPSRESAPSDTAGGAS